MIQAQNIIDKKALVRGMWPGEQQMWINDAVAVIKDQQRQIDELRRRIESAQIAIMDKRTALCLCAPTEEAFPALYALQGHKVALIDLGVWE